MNLKNIPNKWREYLLSELLAEHGELSSGREEVFSVAVHEGLVNQVEHLGRVYAAKDTSNYKLVRPGDIVYTKSPTGDFPYGIIKQSRCNVPVIVSPLYGVFKPRTYKLGTFLDFYFESPVRTNNYLKPISHKGAKNTINITNDTFLSSSIYLPNCDGEIDAIVDILEIAHHEIELLTRQIAACKLQKQGLMQKLLNGKVRVRTT